VNTSNINAKVASIIPLEVLSAPFAKHIRIKTKLNPIAAKYGMAGLFIKYRLFFNKYPAVNAISGNIKAIKMPVRILFLFSISSKVRVR